MKILLLVCLVVANAYSEGPRPIGPNARELKRSIEWNRKLNQSKHLWLRNEESPLNSLEVSRPFSEVEDAGFLLFSAETYYHTDRIKDTLARNLPSGVKLIVYTNKSSKVSKLREHYEKLTGVGNVEVLGLSYPASDRAIWARDNTPIPVLLGNSTAGTRWGAVDAVYYGGDEPDSALANWFHIPLQKNPYEFEGGNFVADSKGNCVIVNKVATAQIPDGIFKTVYGCKRLLRLKHVSGIGHADERVKFIDERLVLTDTPSYVDSLASLGYEVRLLPQPEEGEFRTYVNSLSINDHIFVPVFNEARDEEAIAVYKSTGKEVFTVNSAEISDLGNGSVHCITMTYPKMDLSHLRSLLFR